MNQDADSDSESRREMSLPVGQVVEQLLFAAEAIVRTSHFTEDDRERIESALASVSDALTKPNVKPRQRNLSYGLFVPSERPLTLEEQEALVDM